MHTESYQALRERAAVIDLTGRGLILVKDEDRERLLHAMTTNVVQGLKPGEGNIALFLNDKGRIIADLLILCRADDFLIDTEAATRELVYQHLDHFIIMDVVELEDVTDAYCVLGVEGPLSGDVLASLGATLPENDHAHTAWNGAIIARVTFTGGPGYRVYAPLAQCEELLAKLDAAGAPVCDESTADVVRLEYGKPRHGVDFSDQHLVHEAQLLHYISFTKGCYLGQEIVERVRSRGNVNRLLTRIVVDTADTPAADTPVTAADKEAGKILHAAYSPALGKAIAYSLLRAEHVKPEAELTVAGSTATVAPAGRLG